jgi:hypothetical protein
MMIIHAVKPVSALLARRAGRWEGLLAARDEEWLDAPTRAVSSIDEMDSSRDSRGIECQSRPCAPEAPGEEESAMDSTTIAVDLAKSVFEVAVSRRAGQVAGRHRLSRGQFARFLAEPALATLVMEACGTADVWGREARAHGHRVVLLPPHAVRPYVLRNKTDGADAKGLLEAVRTGPDRRGDTPTTSLAFEAASLIGPRARLSIMARSPSAPRTEAGDTTAVGPSAPRPSRGRISLWEESRYGLLGGESRTLEPDFVFVLE